MLKALTFLIFALGLSAQAVDKISLQKVTREFKHSEKIRDLYKKTMDLGQDPTVEAKPLIKDNQKKLEELQKSFSESASFVRGEIENEEVLGGLLRAFELSMLSVRVQCFQSQWGSIQKQFSNWFLFAADFPYEESSLVGLRTSGVLRSLLLDELERIQGKFSKELAQDSTLRKWFSQVRAPWPVDRVLISEAKKRLKPPMMSVANAAAAAFQKNPYQTMEQVLKKVRGGQSKGAELLKQIWRDSDIEMMKTEINRIGKLRVKFAKTEFEVTHKKPAQTIQELHNAGLLDSVPIDYFTGKPLDLTSL